MEDLENHVSDVLEELVYREDIKMYLLSPIWGSGIIKQQIMENLVRHWTKIAKLGRTIEEASSAVSEIAIRTFLRKFP